MAKAGRSVRGCLVLLGVMLGLGACGSAPTGSSGPSATPVQAGEYRIGPGDQLNIFVFNQPELSVNVPVRPDGLISSPLVENIQAAGKTPSELAREMEKTLSQYVRTPTVNVIVTNFVGNYEDQIRVVGQAAKPQSINFRSGMRVLDVLIDVGGLAEFAAGNRARIVRKIDGKNVEIKIKLDDMVNRGDMTSNVEMRPGDVLIIPESRF